MTTCDICVVNNVVRNLRPFLPDFASDQKLREGKVWNEARSWMCSLIEILTF